MNIIKKKKGYFIFLFFVFLLLKYNSRNHEAFMKFQIIASFIYFVFLQL